MIAYSTRQGMESIAKTKLRLPNAIGTRAASGGSTLHTVSVEP